jgi:hypothetical protein
MNLSLDLFLLKTGFSNRRLEKKSKDLRSSNGDYEGQMYNYIKKTKEHRLFERIALTQDQINEFGLQDLKNPDPEVLRKLEKDPNSHLSSRRECLSRALKNMHVILDNLINAAKFDNL